MVNFELTIKMQKDKASIIKNIKGGIKISLTLGLNLR